MGARFLRIREEKFLPREFGFAVIALSVSTDQRRLHRAGKHHGTGVFMPFQCIQKNGGKSEITFHELGVVLRAVDSRQMKHEIRPFAVFVQLFFGRIEVVFIDFVDVQIGTGFILAGLEIVQRAAEIFPDKALRSRYENLHLRSSFIAASSSRIYCNFSSFSLTCSTFRSCVLSELNSVRVLRSVSPCRKYLS